MHPVSLFMGTVAAAAFGAAAAAQAADPDLARNLAATCANCHGTGGAAQGSVPSLAGVPRDEIAGKLKGYKAGALPGTIMPQLAKGYTDEQIELVAGWFAQRKRAN